MASWLNEILGFFHRKGSILNKLTGWPLIGEIGDRFLVEPPELATNRFGESTHLPTVLEIYVGHNPPKVFPVGELVHDRFFATSSPIIFNVSFSCAKSSLLRGGDYANPESIWFNVFFGFYEIDVRCSEWGRPFGFKNSTPGRLDLEFDDLLRIGKSDWNYFSNYVYGVPPDECGQHDAIPGNATPAPLGVVGIGGLDYAEAEVEGLEVVSGYVSGKDDKRLLNNVRAFSPIWRAVFGRPKKKAAYPKSFISTTMRMRFYARWERGFDSDLECEAYKTFIYGGTVNLAYPDAAENAAFLDAQMDAVRRAIDRKAFRKRAEPEKKAPWKKG
jgi:hypothetical protein